MKTYSLKPADINRKWYLIDASELPLGRLATRVAGLLLGKQKTQVSSHIDCGDYVVIINAQNLVVTGGKDEKKVYYRHSGFPGGLYKRTLGEQRERDATVIVRQAVRGMLPDNKLRNARLKRLKIYSGEQHDHTAQTPEQLNFKRKDK